MDKGGRVLQSMGLQRIQVTELKTICPPKAGKYIVSGSSFTVWSFQVKGKSNELKGYLFSQTLLCSERYIAII